MADKDRDKWDARYRHDLGGTEPSRLVQEFAGLASCGKALDIACGNGRNSLYLAEQGFIVDAIDISTVATNHLAGSNPNIHVICRDIDQWTIPKDRYELIVNVRFLDRRLFPMIQDGLKSGGVLIFESFTGTKKTAYCLQQNELLRVFQSLHILYYQEKKAIDSAKFDTSVSLVAVKCS